MWKVRDRIDETADLASSNRSSSARYIRLALCPHTASTTCPDLSRSRVDTQVDFGVAGPQISFVAQCHHWVHLGRPTCRKIVLHPKSNQQLFPLRESVPSWAHRTFRVGRLH